MNFQNSFIPKRNKDSNAQYFYQVSKNLFPITRKQLIV